MAIKPHRIHKLYDGQPNIMYVSINHNTYCGIIQKSEYLTEDISLVTCQQCLDGIARYSSNSKNTILTTEEMVKTLGIDVGITTYERKIAKAQDEKTKKKVLEWLRNQGVHGTIILQESNINNLEEEWFGIKNAGEKENVKRMSY